MSESKILPENWFPACWVELSPDANESDYKWTQKVNGKLYSLQIMESSEAKMEAANLETIGTLEQRLSDSLLDNEALEIKIDRLKAELAASEERVKELDFELGLRKIARDETIVSLESRLAKMKDQKDRFLSALYFYADPDNYLGISFIPDLPCGDFINDFSDPQDPDFNYGERPGKRAREAIAACENGGSNDKK